MMSYLMLFVFFFQAEDGIRDLVRSRGLGDVYKRQLLLRDQRTSWPAFSILVSAQPRCLLHVNMEWVAPVSYTHLTLPTSDLV